jgi:hypothetical protein
LLQHLVESNLASLKRDVSRLQVLDPDLACPTMLDGFSHRENPLLLLPLLLPLPLPMVIPPPVLPLPHPEPEPEPEPTLEVLV